jgi:hypothetical protein
VCFAGPPTTNADANADPDPITGRELVLQLQDRARRTISARLIIILLLFAAVVVVVVVIIIPLLFY